ncbi:TIGR03986 family CRISPR-associated RAMP protein [uncultured Campylobacter sp.]|uniref:TIGR03986 family type III CRISPR-associated RAMP protein n=1 Tax=uncultured Campylobacter sp. TaxID=218934 RepID=UPI0026133886|nr:TIGR03986 family CRISPR-associated RAMP protein [uncultured Campylobacter sp.]
MITAPYNFVPLNDKIFYPPWASENILKNIHDVPFEDGESGVIELEVTAKSPIFIKDGKNPSEFCHSINENGGKEYYIPATSIKGMIRNVLEIMSFSKIRIDESKHKKYLSVRDMTDRKNLVGVAKGCGFLVKNDNSYMIEDCVDIRTISLRNDSGYNEIEKLKTAEDKYKKFGFLREINFTPYDEKLTNKFGKRIIIKRAKFDRYGQKGILVFTGKIDNKKHEFVFAKNGKKIPLDKSIFEDFKKVYFENKESVDGQYWKEKFNEGAGEKIPIFYTRDGDGKITAIGLTQLFKLAYKKTIFEAAKQVGDETKFDLAETIFGTVRGDKALKGRVYFSHLKSSFERFEAPKEGVFGMPNPSYYPNYLEQQSGAYTTLMSKDAKIRGYKRYPLHSSAEQLSVGNDNEKMKVKFKPLSANSVFKGKIIFHNLKKVEIGALLSAITFHGRSDKFMHNIGFAKPYGYGKIDIELTLQGLKYSQDEYLKEFEKQMNEFVPNWLNKEQLKELCAMASVKYKPTKILQYQQLDNKDSEYFKVKNNRQENNEFSGAKSYNERLSPYSGMVVYSKPQKPLQSSNGRNHGNNRNNRRDKK